jgi:hypothetical protein
MSSYASPVQMRLISLEKIEPINIPTPRAKKSHNKRFMMEKALQLNPNVNLHILVEQHKKNQKQK